MTYLVWPPWAPKGVKSWGWGTPREKWQFSSSKCMVQFYPNLAGILLMGMGCKFVQMVCVSLMGAKGGGGKGQIFQTSSPPALAVNKLHASYIVVKTFI